MVKPFQMQVMAPELRSVSFASQSMGSSWMSQPLRLATSAASDFDIPTIPAFEAA